MSDRPDLSRTFDAAADRYQRARPDYPEQLFDDLIAISGLAPAARLLEIGSGPGKATLPLARRGFRITAIEPGPQLAEQARRNLAGHDVTVINSSFEDWRPAADDHFDLLYAATSWHWLDAETRWQRAADLLADGGHLAVFGASHAFPPDFDPFFTEIQRVYDEIGEGFGEPWPPPTPDELPDPTADYEASGHFVVDAVRRYVWALRYDADSYLDLLDTFSNHIAMEPSRRERLDAEIRRLLGRRPDGMLTRHWVATLVVAHPRPA